jgi:transcriptional regulator with PAS, ATPase and Fis domain
MIIWIRPSASEQLIQRLDELHMRHQALFAEKIEALSPETQQNIVVLEMSDLKAKDWSVQRVHLARSNRFYLVCGRSLTTRDIVSCMKEGAHDVLDFKDEAERWSTSLQKAEQSQQLWLQLYGIGATNPDEILAGVSKPMQTLKHTLRRVGATDAGVLIVGESGVGKERVAQLLHQSRKQKPFIAVNCAAIPRDLLEAELFGATRGSYTGSVAERRGLVREADKGTLFLDEIGEMDIALQPKLLRFLETRTARSIGANEEYQANVRIIAATNRDLMQMSRESKFRQDLYYRLAEVVLTVPPLRDRLEDIPHLAQLFLQQAGERFGKYFERIEPELLARWQAYHWPGNVRQLKHAVEELALFYDGPILRSNWWHEPQHEQPIAPQSTAKLSPSIIPPATRLNKKEKRELALKLLDESQQDLSWVAAQLGIHPTTLYRWRKKMSVT